ncbi:hypothetical protein [Terriglobus aquaticus]|uniref:Porin n=1 Tax=Terriglobus aquaticus TaxID=940139 RepID=A0ABW9KI57_9BACT|nr:hypothetical protein [Terriglobus aquaticus]
MKRRASLTAALLATALLSNNISGQANTAAKSTAKKRRPATRRKVESSSERQIRELREMMAAQQGQIDALKSQLATRDQQVTAAQASASDAQTQAAAAQATTQQLSTQSAQTAADVQQVKSSVAQLETEQSTLTETVVNNQAAVSEQINSPAAIHYKGVTITPVAFFALEGVWRQRSLNSDINTPFNSIPFPSANEGHISEFNFSGRQSRIGALVQGNAGRFALSGYIEADFLSSGTTSNDNQSNSYTLRQRQFWGRADVGGFAVTGGQMWSLVTEDGRSTDVRTEKLPNTVDPQYMVGFSWARQPAIRLQQRFGDIRTGQITAAMSLENAQITNFTATSATTGAVPTNFYFAGTGANGGLFNAFNGTYANNVAPDVIVKFALDYPKAHFELGGLARFMRDRYFPILGTTGTGSTATYVLSTTATNNTKAAGGAFLSARVSPSKYVDLAVQMMAGDGTGRYGSAQLADATLRPDGTLEPIHNYHGLFSLETHPTKNLDVYAYYGGEYAQRTYYRQTVGAFNGALLGYGAPNLNNAGCYGLPANPASSTGGSDSPVNCNAPTRYIQEPMIGFTYRLVSSPKYGRLQYQATYSYLQRNLWSGATGTTGFPSGPRALDNMIHTGMRYYIP